MESRTGASKGRAASSPGGGGPAADAWTPRARSSSNSSPTVAESPEPDLEQAASADEAPRRKGSGDGRRLGVRAVLGVLAIAAILGAAWSFGPVRTILRQSFTRIDAPSTQFYLNGSPWVSGEYLEVPLGVIEQNGPSDGAFKVRLWTLDGTGKTVSSETVSLAYRGGQGTQNLSVIVPASAQIVWAQIVGTSLSVHYRIEGSALPSASASPSGKG